MSQAPTAGQLKPVPTQSQPRPRTNTLLGLALVLWGVSLALTGLVLYADQRHIGGAEILVSGWLSPLALNFAWFANPVFIWVVLRVQAGKNATGLTLLTVLLSLDAMRLSYVPLDAAGGSTQVYGYGWGLVLWFMAMAAMVAAAGTRKVELRMESKASAGIDEWLRPLGLALCVVVPAAAAYLAFQDRKIANAIELTRLSGVAFKRGPVCGASEPSVLQPLGQIAGVVELKLSTGSAYASAYPFERIRRLLDWGIPIVRFVGRDFSLVAGADGPVLTSVPASTPATATLFVFAVREQGEHQISAKLVEQATGRVVFDQTWKSEAKGTRYCPDYANFPKADAQPRKVLTEALAVQALVAAGPPTVAAPNRVNGVLIGEVDAPVALAKSSETNGTRGWRGNNNCPETVGWTGSPPIKPDGLDTGWAFVVGDKAYYPGGRERYYALCEEGHAYLYSGRPERGKYYLTLEKRRLSDFHRAWSGIVVIESTLLAAAGVEVKIASVDEGADELILGLTRDQSTRRLVIKAPLKVSR